MNKAVPVLLLLAVIATAGMLLYPPYMITATGTDLGYHFALQKPAMVAALGGINAGRLLLQLAALWLPLIVALGLLRKS